MKIEEIRFLFSHDYKVDHNISQTAVNINRSGDV